MEDSIRQYAMGNQDIAKYKKLLAAPNSMSTWVKINWKPPKRLIRKMLGRNRKIKNMRFYLRLKRSVYVPVSTK